MRNDMTSRGAVKEVNGDHQKHRDKEQNVQEDFTGCSRLSHVILSSIHTRRRREPRRGATRSQPSLSPPPTPGPCSGRSPPVCDA